jgi:hypothetical protein
MANGLTCATMVLRPLLDRAFLLFLSVVPSKASQSWARCVMKEGEKRTAGAIAVLANLHDCGVTLAGVIGNYLCGGGSSHGQTVATF